MLTPPQLVMAKWALFGLIALGIVAGAKFAVDAYNAAIEGKVAAEARAAELKDDLDNANAGMAKLQEMGRLADTYASKAMEDKERERARAREFEIRLAAAAGQAAVAGDPTARDWLAATVPPLVRGMRRAERASPGGDAVPGADRKAQPDPGAGPSGRNERAAPQRDRRGERVVVGPQGVQP